MEGEKRRVTLSYVSEDGEMDLPLAHLLKYTEGPEGVVDVWLEKMKQGLLTLEHFKDHWKIWVPKVYEILRIQDEFTDKIKSSVLIENFERFIANGDFEEIKKKIHKFEHPPSVCGRVFQVSELAYSCQDCGTDATCVLCVNCFKQSAHKNHNYKMCTSSGGGCCDCGDIEAWKSDPSCETHLLGTQANSDEEETLPPDVAARCRITFYSILKYAYEVLTLENSENDLKSYLSVPDKYCAVLYNDAVCDEVESSFNSLVERVQKVAPEADQFIDIEGMAILKFGLLEECKIFVTDIKKYQIGEDLIPQILFKVVHANIVAHQGFAMSLLRWLEDFLAKSVSLRRLFTDVTLSVNGLSELSIVEGYLLQDLELWKSARSHWHRLFMTGFLMEYSNKKALAKVFANRYGTIVENVILRTFSHSFSVSEWSVQLFTVPTLARHLIAEEQVLAKAFQAMLSAFGKYLNRNGKLEVKRNVSTHNFERSKYVLDDLGYLLNTKPEPSHWTENLRTGFLVGLSQFLILLSHMQDMDLVTRNIPYNSGFEPEWSIAFELQERLAHVITLFIEWCGTDRGVFVQAFLWTLEKLQECHPPGGYLLQGRQVADHGAYCIRYNVAIQPVSIHLPLSRFLAGLYLHLEKFELNFNSPEIQPAVKSTPEHIIEPVLRAQVMIAQIHSGMWQTHGYSWFHQNDSYYDSDCRFEMLDRDILMLQIGATLIPEDEFLIHLLNKFKLLDWGESRSEDTSKVACMKPSVLLVEEFLSLLIAIVGERSLPGVGMVTPTYRVKKEIIQQLCIRPLAHSELYDILPDDENHKTGLEQVIDEVANFKKPSHSSGKGVYELKPEFYKDCNMFFYHYNREAISQAEEEQRKRRRNAGELECCPPPKLPVLTKTFQNLPLLLQSDVMLHILRVSLKQCVDLRGYSEKQLQKVLHLIGYALQEEESQEYPKLMFTEKSERWEIEKLIETLRNSSRLEAHKDMLTWTLNKFREVRLLKGKTEAASSAALVTQETQTAGSSGKESKEMRAKIAAENRARIMERMKAMQKKFMKKNSKLLEANVPCPGKPCDELALMEVEEEASDPVALGSFQTAKIDCEKTYSCILCLENSDVSKEGSALVLPAFVQRSTVHVQPGIRDMVEKLPFTPGSWSQPVTTSCGHVMHNTCWQEFFASLPTKDNGEDHPRPFDVEKQEFLCPLCQCLSNTVLPLLPPLGLQERKNRSPPDISFERFIEGLEITLKLANLKCEDDEETEGALSILEKVKEEMGADGYHFSALFQQESPPFLSPPLVDVTLYFAEATYRKGVNVKVSSYDPYDPAMVWITCHYTILSIESLLHEQEKPLSDLPSRQVECLKNLTRLGGFLGAVWKSHQQVRSHALSILSLILERSPEEGEEGEPKCRLDCFGLLVFLTLSLPNLFCSGSSRGVPTGGILDSYVLKLMFLFQTTRVLLTTEFQVGETEMEVDEEKSRFSEKESDLVLDMLYFIKKTYQDADYVKKLDADYVWSVVKRGCLPFLRCCALFYHFLTNVPYPKTLTEAGGDSFENLCKYLSLPLNVSDLFGSPKCKELMSKELLWMSHNGITGAMASESFAKLPKPVNYLVSLPSDYSELMNKVFTFKCPKCDRNFSPKPTMCLVCGEMMCSCYRWNQNTKLGPCMYHAQKCGGDYGMFLRVRECEVLLLGVPNRGCVLPAPYLDRYGESDRGLARGNPLTLSNQLYKQLTLLRLVHGLHEKIASTIDYGYTLWEKL